MALGKFTKLGAAPEHAALGVFAHAGQPRPYGFVPSKPGRKIVSSTVPALHGLFRAGGITVGISQVNMMATYVPRGSGH